MVQNSIINKKEIIIFSIFLSLSLILYKNAILGSAIAASQILYVLATLLITKSIKKAFYWHILFLFSSIEYMFDKIYKDEGAGIIFGYKHLELPFLPISISTLLTIFLFFLTILHNKKIKFLSDDLTFKIVIVFFILPLFTGIIGILFKDYEFKNFLGNAMQPFIYLCIYILLLEHRSKEDINRLKSLITSALIGSVIASYIAAFWGVRWHYSVLLTFPMNQIMLFSPFLIWLAMFYKGKQRLFLIFIGISACINLIIFNSTGKGIIFVALALILFGYKLIANLKNVVVVISIIALIVSIPIFASIKLKDDRVFKHKLKQVTSLFNINNWKEDLANIPKSPRARIIETIDIFLTHKENGINLIIGGGFGAYFTDKSGLFEGYDLSQGVFSEKEIESGKFVRPHESFNNILLTTGFLGLGLWLLLILKLLIQIKRNKAYKFSVLLSLIFVSILWNVFVIFSILGLMILFVLHYTKKEEFTEIYLKK